MPLPQEGEKFRGTLNSLAFGNAMEHAAKDYMKLKEKEEEQERPANQVDDVDVNELIDDPELERLHNEKLAAMQREHEARMKMQSKGHGEYQEVEEGDFLEAVTGSDLCVVHFFCREFERCKIVDKHMKLLAPKYFGTRFLGLNAPECAFFVAKLKVQMLPCVVLFKNGVAFDRIVGFGDLGGKDDFTTDTFERKLQEAEVITKPKRRDENSDSEEEEGEFAKRVRAGGYRGKLDSDDEDSDFD